MKKLERCSMGMVVNETQDIKDQHEYLTKCLAEKLIEEGFVFFHDDAQVSGYRFLTATVYAVKIL